MIPRRQPIEQRRPTRWWTASLVALACAPASAEDRDDLADYKNMSLEELMEIEVISTSKTPERWTEAASAIQVIAGEDIRRSGAMSLTEALRLAPNLQVAQVNASQWAISARGFNNVLANKLLVMIDGRTVYTPFYAGVFWDIQNTVLEDIDRIEVTSGPGGALWGANAVNGVINIVTKSARDSQGGYVSVTESPIGRDSGAARYGDRIGEALFFRVYAQRFVDPGTVLPDGEDAGDNWDATQGGFRIDWEPGMDRVTLQGDLYDADPNPDATDTPVAAHGGNLLGRWSRDITPDSSIQVQAYYDRTVRDFNNGFAQTLDTYDVEWQHRFPLGARQEVIWGLGYRLMDDHVDNLELFRLDPGRKRLHLPTAFIQDTIALIERRLSVTIGSKFEHNAYTGFEYQPSARLAWTPNAEQTFWGAVSRAVRTPSRIDREFSVLIAPGVPLIQGSGDFRSEELLAYEIGWRFQPSVEWSVSLATFYNVYDHLRTAEPGPPPLGIPITFGNGVEGHTYGCELAAGFQAADWWRLRGGYTYLHKKLRVKSSSADLNDGTVESNDPEHQFLLQSMIDLPRGFQLDLVGRYVDRLPDPEVPSYAELDIRLAYRATSQIELAIVGQNLLHDQHAEYIAESEAREIERSVYGTLTARW